jgi:hypothetical protein
MTYDSQIPYFLERYLSRPASALPKNALWIVDFQDVEKVRPAILRTAELEPAGLDGSSTGWDVENGLNTIINSYLKDSTSKGCLFAQAVSVPGESFVANPEGIQQQNLIRTTVGGGRDPYTGLQMTFLDTNVSFVDSVIRPWVLTTARLGMKARSAQNQIYRATITVYKLGIYSPTESPVILQQYKFHGACPTSVSSEEFNYVAATSPINREVTFSFHYYTFKTINNKFTQNTPPNITKDSPSMVTNLGDPDDQIPQVP